MKYLIETNLGDFIFEKKLSAATWLKRLNNENKAITSLWVYDDKGMWIDAAEIVNGNAVKKGIYPDGAYRMWVVWACQVFENNDYCKIGYEEAYYSVLRLRDMEEEKCKQITGTTSPIYSLYHYFGDNPLKEIKKAI